MMDNTFDIPFVKMQGTGNDFVVLDNREERFSLNELISLTPDICHRKYGVGADGLLALQKPVSPDLDYTMVYRNADGSDAGMCGNGSRCLALFAERLGLGDQLTFNVHDSIYKAEVRNGEEIVISFPTETSVNRLRLPNENEEQLWQVYTGTEHIVLHVDAPKLEQVNKLRNRGRELRHHDHFRPKGTNVNFICGVNEHKLRLQTYERGVEDLTLACGTGAIAAAICWHNLQELGRDNQSMEVETKGGILRVDFTYQSEEKTYNEIKLVGPAEFVFDGRYHANI